MLNDSACLFRGVVGEVLSDPDLARFPLRFFGEEVWFFAEAGEGVDTGVGSESSLPASRPLLRVAGASKCLNLASLSLKLDEEVGVDSSDMAAHGLLYHGYVSPC